MATILYAESDRDCRELFAYVLRSEGHRVLECVNGAQAVQVARDEPIDLVILEVRLPMMTGYDAARMIGREMPQLPILFLSARGLAHEVERGFDCGPRVVDYVIKPATPAQLVRRLEGILWTSGVYGPNMVRQESLARADLAHVRLRPES
jgi:DNA-binding response OmpR family regulator